MSEIISIFIAYLLGSFPTGLIVGRLGYQVDLRKVGSCNIGATNTYRILGIGPALLVFAGDFLKGLIAVYLGSHNPLLAVLCAAAALLGHLFSIFLRFRGGRGVATGLGVCAYLTPWGSLIAILVWGIAMWGWRIVSVASILAAISYPMTSYLLGLPREILVFTCIAAILVVIKHRDNLVRLWHGEEKPIARARCK